MIHIYFVKFSGLPGVFVIKRLIYVEIGVLWKGKEKEKKKKKKKGTGSAGGQNGLLPILRALSPQRKSVATGFPRPCVTTGFLMSR